MSIVSVNFEHLLIHIESYQTHANIKGYDNKLHGLHTVSLGQKNAA